MAINTYSALQSAIASTLNRTDLTAVIPDWITLAEAQMRRTVRHWRQEVRAVADVSSRLFALPDDWLEAVRIHDPNTATRLDLISHAELQDLRAASALPGAPRKYAFVGAEIEFYPVPDGEYLIEMVYRAEIPALSNSTTSNWVLQYFPDAYLYGSLIHSAPYLAEDSRLQTFAALFNAAVEGINSDDARARWSGTGLRKRV